MTFRLHQAKYDDQTERAYVELRSFDGTEVSSSWLPFSPSVRRKG
jgi:hypothetical protein